MRTLARIRKVPFALAGIWAIGASLYLLLRPQTVVSAVAVPGSPGVVEEIQTQVSWYEVQGLWGVFILFLFGLLYASIWLFANLDRYVIAGLISVAAIALTILASLSIGPLYLPSVVMVVAGWLLMGLVRLMALERSGG